MGRIFTELGNDVSRDAGLLGFEAFGVDSVVADQRISLAENLTLIGWIGDGFGITYHPGVENDFPPNFGPRAKSYALVDASVSEGQNSFPDGAFLRFIFGEYSIPASLGSRIFLEKNLREPLLGGPLAMGQEVCCDGGRNGLFPAGNFPFRPKKAKIGLAKGRTEELA